jgi:hypothetical protein
MANWYKIPPSRHISEREYRANVSGMNIVFGAVLGFVLAGAEGLAPIDFMIVLFVSALAVILILYLGSSEYILFYGVGVALLIFFIPSILTDQLTRNPIPYLQPTLAVWATMVALVELLPRQKHKDAPLQENEK